MDNSMSTLINPTFSLAPGDGRIREQQQHLLMQQQLQPIISATPIANGGGVSSISAQMVQMGSVPATKPILVSSAAVSAPVSATGATLVMDYTTDFPELPIAVAPTSAHENGTGSHTAWTKPMKLRSSNVSLVFHLPIEERSSGGQPFGEKLSREQERCNQIAQETNTTIELSESKDGTLTVVLNGKREQADEARRRVVSLLQQQAVRELSIPKDHHRSLIGKEGRRLKELEEETDCRITVPGRDTPSQIIRITGPRDGIEKAAHKIVQLSEQQAKLAQEHLTIEREYWPWIRGPNNETIDALQTACGVRVNIPPPSANNTIIVVSGEKEGVHKAATQLRAIYANMKSKCKTMTLNIPKAQHRYVIGPGGSGLADVLKQTGVSVEVPPEQSDSCTITLRGELAALSNAAPLVYGKATSVITRTVTAPVWLHRWIIGVKGVGIRQIQGERQRCQVDFEDDGSIIVHGPPEDVVPVEQKLVEMVASMVKSMDTKTIKVAPAHHRHIIGKQGGVVNKMKTDYGVQIQIPDNSTNSDEIRIEGPRDGVAKAAKEILEMATRIENERTKDVVIEQRFHRLLIGQGGAVVAEMRSKFPGVQLQFPEPGRKSDVVQLRGPKDAVDACYKHVTKQVKTWQDESYEQKVPIFKDFHRVIIGKGGATIKKIREDTGCRIDLPKEASGDMNVTVTGRKEAVEKAVAQLQKIETELAQIETKDLIIAHKLHTRMLGGGGRMIADIAAECGGVHIRFPDKADSDKVRLRGPKDDVARAETLLLALAKDRELSSFEDSLKFKPDQRRFLIGRGGANLRPLRDAYPDVRVMIPRDGDADQETIHLVGRQEEVPKVKAELLKMIKALDEVVEKKINVDAVYHKHFVQRGAAVLRDIQDECGGCVISFPKMQQSSPTSGDKSATAPADAGTAVSIKGSVKGVEQAAERIHQIVDDLKCAVTEYMDIPFEHHRTLLTRCQDALKRIEHECNVHVRFPDRNVQANEAGDHAATGGIQAPNAVTLTGRPQSIVEARRQLSELIPVTEEVPVPTAMHGALIGKGGADIRQFQQDYDVNLKVPNSDGSVYVTGTPSNVRAAVDALMARVNEHAAAQFTCTVTVPAEYHARIIGPRGANINQYRTKYGVNVIVPRGDAAADQITIVGVEERAFECRADIERLLGEWQSLCRHDIKVDPRIHARIIGGRGRGVAKIMEQYSVTVRFPKEGDADPAVVTVEGATEDRVLDAVDHIKNLEEEYMQDHNERGQYERGGGGGAHENSAAVAVAPATAKGGATLTIKNAPWELNSAADFPPMLDDANAPTASSAGGGVWGRKR